MRSMLTFLNVFIFFLKVISDDASLFSDSGSYPSDLDSSDDQSLWSDDSSLGTDDPLPGGSMFDETSPQMLSFDGCSSGGGDLGMVGGDLGIMRKIRRGQVCRPETGTGTQGALEPTNPEPEESPPSPDDQKNNAPDPLHSLPYMPPPSLDGLGCGDVGEQIFIYTVCGSKNRGGPTPSTLIQFRLPTFSVTNAELMTAFNFICLQPRSAWCCAWYYWVDNVGEGVSCVELYILQGFWKRPNTRLKLK